LHLEGGTSPFGDWFAALDPIAAAKVSAAIYRIGRGNFSNIEWFRGIGEYKVNWGPGYRVYLARDGMTRIVLLGGGTKKGQQKDIDLAIQRWNSYKRRKGR